MERTFLFLGLMYFCCTREASPMKTHSSVNSQHVYMVERTLEMANYPTQDVYVEQLSIKLGSGVLYKAIFSNRGQHCYLQFSTMKYPRIEGFHRLICDSPCPRGECEVEDMFFGRLHCDKREKKDSYGQKRTRNKGGFSHRKFPHRASFEHIDELSVRRRSNEIFDVREPQNVPRHQSRREAHHRAFMPQELFGSGEPYYDFEESHDLDGQLRRLVPSIQSTDGYKPFRGSKILPINPDLDGSQLLTSHRAISRYFPGKTFHGHRGGPRKCKRKANKSRKHKTAFWNRLFSRLNGPGDTKSDIYIP